MDTSGGEPSASHGAPSAFDGAIVIATCESCQSPHGTSTPLTRGGASIWWIPSEPREGVEAEAENCLRGRRVLGVLASGHALAAERHRTENGDGHKCGGTDSHRARDVNHLTPSAEEATIGELMRSLTFSAILLASCAPRADQLAPPAEPALETEAPVFPYQFDDDPPDQPIPRAETKARPNEDEPSALPPSAWSTPTTPASQCCRICRSGKACGNTCIATERTCQKPRGCACDG